MAKTNVAKDTTFGTTPNHLLNDKNISLKAKGLYTFIQSKPNNWAFSAERITLQTKDGLDGVKTALKELESHGYLTRRKFKNEKGQWDSEYALHVFSESGKTHGGKTHVGKTAVGKPTNISNKDIVIKISNKDTDSEETSQGQLISEVIDLFKDINPSSYRKWFGNTTQRKACEELLEIYGMEKIRKVIAILPQTNRIQFLPTITTPLQLQDKWASLEANLKKKKGEAEALANKYPVAFV